MTGSPKISNLKNEWKNYPNKLDLSLLSKGTNKEAEKLPRWYQWIHKGDRIKLEVPGNTPATCKKKFQVLASVLYVTTWGLVLEVESWSGFGTYQLTLSARSQERILWYSLGLSSKILKRIHANKKIQKQDMSF